MGILIATYSIYFSRPWWLLGAFLVVPVVWLGLRHLGSLGRVRRISAIVLRCVLILILVALLARLTWATKSEKVTVIAVLDRSLSIPVALKEASLEYLEQALTEKAGGDLVAVVDVAETATISKLPSSDTTVRERNTTLTGEQTNLAAGIEMAMAIAPADTAVRIVLISEGNQTSGDVKEAARTAAMNGIPVSVLSLRYEYEREVMFRRLAAPARARSGETVSLRFILDSTSEASGKLLLTLNDKPVDLAPDSPEVAAAVDLQPGTNVKTISLPVGMRGSHEFEAVFIPDDSRRDRISENNRASTMTFVAGPGYILVTDTDGESGRRVCEILGEADMSCRYRPVDEFPDSLVRLMNTDAIILVNTDCSRFTFGQQEMLCRYVNELGGGLIMVGGSQSFGAGGWIGSPVAEILPVELDPPQKKQLPKGALVLIMHACEMPNGNYWGKKVAISAVKTLSSLDLVGVLAYDWEGGGDDWVVPFGKVGDKKAAVAKLKRMQMGDMPDLGAHLQSAYDKLSTCDAAQKHVIVISDGDPAPPTGQLLNQMKEARITCSGVAIFPHSPSDIKSLIRVAKMTGGRFYHVKNAQQLPQIFIKEAQVVRRSLIVEESFVPNVSYSLSEILKGLRMPLPRLDGYVLTGRRSGLSQMVLSSGSGDPILATRQSGLGRCIAFTSSLDSRWASGWLSWGGVDRFWEQAVRWAAKPAQPSDCEVMVDVQGRRVNVGVEALDEQGEFMQFAHIDAQVIEPDMSSKEVKLQQVGPGQFEGDFEAGSSGSYIVNLRYKELGEDKSVQMVQAPVTVPFAPEYRHLSDNAGLMAEVSEITDGRMLVSDPSQADIFSHTGLDFPERSELLTRPLLLAWIVVLLLDVALRRVVVDFRAVGTKIISVVRGVRKGEKGKGTLERLKARHKKLREQLSARGGEEIARRRYEGAEKYEGELPTAKVEREAKEAKEEVVEREKEKKAAEEEPVSHIERLKRAKEKAKKKKQNQGGSNNKE